MKELLFSITKKDFDIDFFSGSGAGGQHRNKHQNCIRLRHRDSGVAVTGQNHRERSANLKDALNSLVGNPKFKLWYNGKLQEVITGKSVEQKVTDLMRPENLKIETKKDGKWCDI
jgi:peptide chain release factor 1